ncbi:hypothetical protein M3B92_02360 [Brevibacterium casei]|uniref:hypothetical protein n=1 Tax=Brevibacterium casei TaxID=33889 RepID=UPI00223B0086|nr:hypothetical protein [Brevibacterium casei]MCT1764957.1 hypothetical protein [Brevibacterium casei]
MTARRLASGAAGAVDFAAGAFAAVDFSAADFVAAVFFAAGAFFVEGALAAVDFVAVDVFAAVDFVVDFFAAVVAVEDFGVEDFAAGVFAAEDFAVEDVLAADFVAAPVVGFAAVLAPVAGFADVLAAAGVVVDDFAGEDEFVFAAPLLPADVLVLAGELFAVEDVFFAVGLTFVVAVFVVGFFAAADVAVVVFAGGFFVADVFAADAGDFAEVEPPDSLLPRGAADDELEGWFVIAVLLRETPDAGVSSALPGLRVTPTADVMGTTYLSFRRLRPMVHQLGEWEAKS